MKITAAVDALAASAQESRLLAFRLLVQAGKEGLAAGVLAEKLGIPLATLSFHLKGPAHARLVKSRTEGRYVIYTANYAEMDKLIAYLTDCYARAAIYKNNRILSMLLLVPEAAFSVSFSSR